MLVCRLGHIRGGKQITKILDGMKGDQRDAADEVRGFFQLGATYGPQDCNTKLRFLLPTGKAKWREERWQPIFFPLNCRLFPLFSGNYGAINQKEGVFLLEFSI